MQSESLGSWFGGDGDPQAPCDAAVVIPTVLRPALLTSLESVFRQDLDGRIQVLIGVDAPSPAPPALLELIARRPANVSVLLLTLPYSTSIRHGGVHRATDGGSLRSILTFMAASRHVAYLDDDNAWERDHLSSLRAAIAGKAWAYSLRMLVDEASGEELGIDRWDSVGPGRGRACSRTAPSSTRSGGRRTATCRGRRPATRCGRTTTCSAASWPRAWSSSSL